MTDFAQSWTLSRQRFVDEIKDLSDAQLQWRMHPGSLSIGQMALHVAGVEVSFSSQLLGIELDAERARLRKAATDGVVNDKPFPWEDSQITALLVSESLSGSKAMVEPVLTDPSAQILEKQLQSALGPVITGQGALARLGFHSAYHQGQAYLMKTSPAFPKA
ncbi:MAG TPA: DinB family protein [Fimbriimonas sp.]|nr:DinB family protein [Fimbriimonas sp.]